jgi:hypothetical protein
MPGCYAAPTQLLRAVLGECATMLRMSDQPGRWYALPPIRRDEMIVKLRRAGWTHARIGRRVGMSESGVRRALERIRGGGFGEGMTRD